MAELPSGTVTFLFTDLEGSTRLWDERPDAMRSALARHDELVRAAVAARGGVVVKGTGDGVHAAFSTAADAVAFYEKSMRDKVHQLRTTSPDKLAREVDFFGFMKAPAVTFLAMAQNHSVHHRGQLAAYLRAMGSHVPSIYGGSADEPFQAAAAS